MSKVTEDWIEDLEIPDATVKWPFSNFDGRRTDFNEEGDHNFTMVIPRDDALRLRDVGWNIKELDPYEEGDESEFTLRANISYRFEQPRVYLIKGNRKIRAEKRDLSEITRTTCERIDVILQPSRWVSGGRTGVSAYVKEMYATIKESRFAAEYADYEEI